MRSKQNSNERTEELDLVSCGHDLGACIVALLVWNGQHHDALSGKDCSLTSLAGSGGRLPGVEIFNFMSFHVSPSDPLVSGTGDNLA